MTEYEVDLKLATEAAEDVFHDSIQNASNNTDRSLQQQDMYIGVSTLGHCRQYAALMMKQTPFSDKRDKTAAFFGTIAGEAIEAQIKIDHPTWLTQEKLMFPVEAELMMGGEIKGTSDVLIPFSAQDPANHYYQGVWDGKSKAELETIKKYGASRQQIFQVHAYARAAIAKGLLNPDYPIVVGDVFFDRSGKDVKPYGIFHLYKEEVVEQINDWINDVIYAVMNGEDAERDMTRDWCYAWCEYATVCRGLDTDVSGLIEDPEAIAAIETYAEWSKKETEAKKAKEQLKKTLANIEPGSTGKYLFRKNWTNPTHVEYDKKGFYSMDIRAIKGTTE